jgi:hypothetical protein
MKTFLKLLIVIMMITNAHSQVTVTSNFIIDATTVSKSNNTEFFSVIDNTPTNDIVCGFSEAGQIFVKVLNLCLVQKKLKHLLFQ